MFLKQETFAIELVEFMQNHILVSYSQVEVHNM